MKNEKIVNEYCCTLAHGVTDVGIKKLLTDCLVQGH
jgi:hypothetical protein